MDRKVVEGQGSHPERTPSCSPSMSPKTPSIVPSLTPPHAETSGTGASPTPPPASRPSSPPPRPTHGLYWNPPAGIVSPSSRPPTPTGARSCWPRRARNFLRSIQSRAKTDKLDSRGLALFALSQPLSPYPIKTPMQEHLDQLLSARKGLSRAAATLGQQRQELPHAAQPLTIAITELNAQVKEMDRQIAALTTQAPEMRAAQALAKVPGIGEVTAAALASRLSGNRFSHPDKLVAYLGLDVGVQQSGKHRGERGLTKQGDAELRRLLFLCASASLRAKDTVFKEQYEREKAKGLATTAALCAVARKMAKVCWSLARHGTEYNAQRVRQQLPSKEQKEDQEKKSGKLRKWHEAS